MSAVRRSIGVVLNGVGGAYLSYPSEIACPFGAVSPQFLRRPLPLRLHSVFLMNNGRCKFFFLREIVSIFTAKPLPSAKNPARVTTAYA